MKALISGQADLVVVMGDDLIAYSISGGQSISNPYTIARCLDGCSDLSIETVSSVEEAQIIGLERQAYSQSEIDTFLYQKGYLPPEKNTQRFLDNTSYLIENNIKSVKIRRTRSKAVAKYHRAKVLTTGTRFNPSKKAFFPRKAAWQVNEEPPLIASKDITPHNIVGSNIGIFNVREAFMMSEMIIERRSVSLLSEKDALNALVIDDLVRYIDAQNYIIETSKAHEADYFAELFSYKKPRSLLKSLMYLRKKIRISMHRKLKNHRR